MALLFGPLPTQQNNIGFVALAAFSPRTRDFFAVFCKFGAFERAALVPAAAGNVPCAFPGAPAGRRGTGRGAGRSHRQAKQHEKSTRSFDLVLSCTSTGMRALASPPDVPCKSIIAHRRGVVNRQSASKGICQALVALQIPLTWYNLAPRQPEPRGRAREKRAGFARPCAPRGWSRRRTPKRPPRHPDAKGGTGGPADAPAGGRGKGRRGPAAARRATAPPRGSPEQPKGPRVTSAAWGVRATGPQAGT